MYFSKFPKTTYTINGKTESVVDVFRKVVLSKENVDNIYLNELVQDSDTLESLATKYYGDPSFSWIILLTNDIVDPNTEFIRSSEDLQSLINTKYSGNILYFEENISLQEGDILIGVTGVTYSLTPSELGSTMIDSSTYCFVSSYDNEFRFARITNVNGTIDETKKLAAFRKINNELTLLSFTKQFTSNTDEQDAFIMPVKKKDTYINSPTYFYNADTDEIISAYRGFSGSALQNSYIDTDAYGAFTGLTNSNAFRQSILYKVAMDGGVVTNVSLFTLGQEIAKNNEKFRTIKILPKNLINPFIETFNDLISNDDIRFRLINSRE